MADIVASNETIIVVGFGISGMTAYLKAAVCGAVNLLRIRDTSTLVDKMGAEADGEYDHKVSCCDGALALFGPDKAHAKNRDIIDSAYDHGAEIITTPCPVCQMDVEVYQEHINTKCGTDFNIPVVYYSELMSVAYDSSVKEPGLNGQIIRAKKLEEIAKK